jgi:hypothetical protein
MSSRNTDEGPLIYHDFDYIGYEQSNRNQKRTPEAKKSKKANNYRSIAVGDTNKLQQRSMKSIGTNVSPRVSN